MSMGAQEARRGHLAMLSFSALVAGSFSLGGMVGPFIEPEVLNAIRFAFVALVLGALAWMTGGMQRETFRAPWRYLFLAGLFAIYFVSMFEGLKTAQPVSMAAVFTLTPAMSAVFGFFLLRQITTWRMALAIVTGAFGALWVIFRGDFELARRFEVGFGEMLFLGGCAAHALYTPLLRKLSRGEPAMAFVTGILIAGALILSIWAGRDLLATDWAALPAIVWVTIAYTALAATGLTFLALRYATLRLPSAKVMAYTYLVPSWVILWELALGRSVPTAMVLPGVGLTVFALILLLKDEEPQPVSA